MGTILIVDDKPSTCLLFRNYLKKEGYSDISIVHSAEEAFLLLGMTGDARDCPDVDLILMDLVMTGLDGIEACRRIKNHKLFCEIPILVVSATDAGQKVEAALEAGALDYIRKPVDRIELAARVRATLKLRHEMDMRRRREVELEKANRKLQDANAMLERLSLVDPLTGIGNRRYLDQSLTREWNRCIREQTPLSMIMIDIDYFKRYNDRYGHQQGDVCLKMVASVLKNTLNRPGDFVARYGGEEFSSILPNTRIQGALLLAEKMRQNIEKLNIPHEQSEAGDHVTISLGVASLVPANDLGPDHLIRLVDQALYKAKTNGRNRAETFAG